MFLAQTVNNLLTNIRGDTDIIAVLDGEWADPPIKDDPRVTLIYHDHPVGQRAACNEAARVSRAKYVMKLDAHCAVDEGFDVKLLSVMQDDMTLAPGMYNLHAFDFVCTRCGLRVYQGPDKPCPKCGSKMDMDIIFKPKRRSPFSTSFCFDPEPHFRYFNEYKKRPEAQGDLVQTMSLQGSCWMINRERYFDLNICDESLGSWGSMGIEVACKSWLSGGRVMVYKKTWQAHLFRSSDGFSFPYEESGRQVQSAKTKVRELFFYNRWPRQTRPLSWLVERFWPVYKWTQEDLERIKQYDGNVRGGDLHMLNTS